MLFVARCATISFPDQSAICELNSLLDAHSPHPQLMPALSALHTHRPHVNRSQRSQLGRLTSDLPRVQPCKALILSNFFYNPWIELRFCMCTPIHLLRDGKFVPTKKTGWDLKTNQVSRNNVYIVLASLATCFGPEPIVLLSEPTVNRLYKSHKTINSECNSF